MSLRQTLARLERAGRGAARPVLTVYRADAWPSDTFLFRGTGRADVSPSASTPEELERAGWTRVGWSEIERVEQTGAQVVLVTYTAGEVPR